MTARFALTLVRTKIANMAIGIKNVIFAGNCFNVKALSLFQTLVVATNVGDGVNVSRTISYHDYEIGTGTHFCMTLGD